MTTLDKIRFNLWDSVGTVVTLINRWSPGKCNTEKDYEQSFLRFLNKEIPEIKITPQFALGRSKADLLIGNKIIVEIKKDLMTTSKYNRLIGQLIRYKEWDRQVIVLLVGKTAPDLKLDLEKFRINSSFIISKKCTLIEK